MTNAAHTHEPREAVRARPRLLSELASFAQVERAFRAPLGNAVGFPPDLAELVRKIELWNRQTLALWTGFERRTVAMKVVRLAAVLGDGMRLQRMLRTQRIDDWLAGAPAANRQAFESWRTAFFDRGDALGALCAEALIASDLLMPEHGLAKVVVHNTAQLGGLFGARQRLLGMLAVWAGLVRVGLHEREFFMARIGRQLRMQGLSFSGFVQARRAKRLNAAAGRHLISRRHAEEIRAAYRALHLHGVRGARADALALEALEYGHAFSGKSWKGLIRMSELIEFSGLDPALEDFGTRLRAAMQAPVDYTHVPGKEWVVRDFELGRKLMQLDGSVAPGEFVAALQQGRGSLATGYLRAGAARTEFGRRYSNPLGAFLDSMVVAEGADHQRQRKAFLPFFSQRSILEHAQYAEETTERLLGLVEDIARRNDGAFDFTRDFAYHFPIRIICRVLDLPEADVGSVQHWAESSVRAMDTAAGVSVEIANQGQRASDEFRAYLQGKLDDARNGRFTGALITAIAHDPTLNEAERIANLGVIIFAGFETTTGLLSKGMLELLHHRAQWDFLAASLLRDPEVEMNGARVHDRDLRWLVWSEAQPERNVDLDRRDRLSSLVHAAPALQARLDAVRSHEHRLDAAIEEMLRWTAPGSVVPLTASKHLHVELPSAMLIQCEHRAAGDALEFKRGETISVAVDELNRRCPFGGGKFDPAAKGGFDVSRTDNTSHLSFGLRHSCIGAFLAKENAKRALDGVLRRFPDLELNGDPVPQDMELFSGLARLPVRSRRAAVDPDPR